MLTTVLAVLLALIGTGGVLLYVQQANTRALAGQRAVSTLVAAQAIPAGTSASAALRQGMLVSQKLPASSVPADAVAAITPELGALVMSAQVPPGQLLLRPMLVTSAQVTGAGVLAIPSGMVAVTVPLCLPAAVAGYVQPGSKVAVFDTYSLRNLQVSQSCSGSSQTQSAQGSGGIRTRMVLPRVLVLSVSSAPAKSAASTTALGSSSAASSTSGPVLVTMAVSQPDAERLILLTETGLPYLALLTPSSQTGFDTGLQPLFRP
jgi:pilus assembly protein CpaB